MPSNFNAKSTQANILWAILSQTIEKAAGYLILAVLTRTLLKIELGEFFFALSLVAYTSRALIPVLWTYVLLNLILVIAAITLVRTYFGTLQFQFDIKKNRDLMRLSVPFFLFNLLTVLHMRFDTTLVGIMLGFQQVANYELGIKMMEVARFIVRPLYSVYFPAFSEYVADGRQEKLRIRLGQLLILSGGAGMVLAAGMWVFGTYLVYWLFEPNYEQSILPARILFLSVPFLFIGFVSSIAATALHLEHKMVRILSLSVAINLGLNVFVIPTYGIIGAA